MLGSSSSAATWLTNLADLLQGVRPPVALCYHGVAAEPPTDDPHGLVVREGDFAAHLDQLAELGYRLVTAAELWRVVEREGKHGAAGLAAVTFDDGMADTLHLAARHLAERGGEGTAFVLPGLLDAPHPDLPGARLATADELHALARGPLELGSHTSRHTDLTQVPDASVVRDLRTSREELEEILELPVPGLAYPYGRYTHVTVAAAEEAGFDYACACSGAARWRRYEVPREPVFPSTSARRLRVKAAGLYGPAIMLAEWRNRLRG